VQQKDELASRPAAVSSEVRSFKEPIDTKRLKLTSTCRFLLVSKKLTTLKTFRLREESAHHSSSVFKDHLFLNNDVVQIVRILS
jgi:hypothetical protein